MLGSQGRLFFLFGRRRGRRTGIGGLKVRLAEEHLRAELRQELGLSVTIYFSLHVLTFLHCMLNMALRSTTSTGVAYWRRSRSHCLPKQRLRLLKQGGHEEGHDKGLHHSSLALRLHSLGCASLSLFSSPLILNRQHRPTRILNTLIIFSSYVSV
jgi:hypothetical protein